MVDPIAGTRRLRLVGNVPPEVWNRLGTKTLPKRRAGSDLTVKVEFAVDIRSNAAATVEAELRQILQELGLEDAVRIE